MRLLRKEKEIREQKVLQEWNFSQRTWWCHYQNFLCVSLSLFLAYSVYWIIPLWNVFLFGLIINHHVSDHVLIPCGIFKVFLPSAVASSYASWDPLDHFSTCMLVVCSKVHILLFTLTSHEIQRTTHNARDPQAWNISTGANLVMGTSLFSFVSPRRPKCETTKDRREKKLKKNLLDRIFLKKEKKEIPMNW